MNNENKFKEKYKRKGHPTSVNLAPEIKERIKKEAEKNERSISAQISYIIKEYYNFKDN